MSVIVVVVRPKKYYLVKKRATSLKYELLESMWQSQQLNVFSVQAMSHWQVLTLRVFTTADCPAAKIQKKEALIW